MAYLYTSLPSNRTTQTENHNRGLSASLSLLSFLFSLRHLTKEETKDFFYKSFPYVGGGWFLGRGLGCLLLVVVVVSCS